MSKSEERQCRRRAWSYALIIWSLGATLVVYVHASLPDHGFGRALEYLMYFGEFWYFLALGELHRCFYVWIARRAH